MRPARLDDVPQLTELWRREVRTGRGYRKLGFEVTNEAEVWEATLP